MSPKRLRSFAFGLFAALTVASVASACRFWESPEAQVVRLRAERREMLDDLYRRYRGIPDTKTDGEAAPVPPPSGNVEDMAIGVLESADRAVFENNLSAVGRGERPLTITPEGRAFFEREDIRKAARKIYEMEITIESAEKRLKAGI